MSILTENSEIDRMVAPSRGQVPLAAASLIAWLGTLYLLITATAEQGRVDDFRPSQFAPWVIWIGAIVALIATLALTAVLLRWKGETRHRR